jgi:hypothetical protein
MLVVQKRKRNLFPTELCKIDFVEWMELCREALMVVDRILVHGSLSHSLLRLSSACSLIASLCNREELHQ